MSKPLANILKWLLVITLPFLVISASIGFCFNFNPLYNYGYHRFDIERETGIDKSELQRATDEIIDYFNAPDEKDIDIHVMKNDKPMQLFNEKEISHMRDVKDLVQLDYTIMRVLFIIDAFLFLLLLARHQQKKAAQALVFASLFTTVILALIGIAMITDFTDFFILFHHIAFDNTNWLLDPTTDYLLMMFPENFWVMALLSVLILIFLAIFIMMFVGISSQKKINASEQSNLSV